MELIQRLEKQFPYDKQLQTVKNLFEHWGN